MPTDVLSYVAGVPGSQDTELPRELDEEVSIGQPAGFWAQWMLDRPETVRIRPDELTMERVRQSRGRFMLVADDDRADEIARLFRGEAPS